MQDPHKTSVSLIERARSKQGDAWDRLVELYAPLVHHWCRQAHLSPDDLADVFQDVFQAVAQHLDKFQHGRQQDTFRGWLRTITRNKIRDHFRRTQDEPAAMGGSVAQGMIQHVPDPHEDESSEANLVQAQIHRALEWIEGEFEPRTWKAFWAVQIDNREPKEVGEELAMTAAAVRKARYRVLARLKEELDGLMF